MIYIRDHIRRRAFLMPLHIRGIFPPTLPFPKGANIGVISDVLVLKIVVLGERVSSEPLTYFWGVSQYRLV